MTGLKLWLSVFAVIALGLVSIALAVVAPLLFAAYVNSWFAALLLATLPTMYASWFVLAAKYFL